jgi:NAD(P)-dependent dehydrogenase (short-subunit alcohol dehydrogenase family)
MGLATAQLLASRGARISLADINERALEDAIQSLPNSDKHMSTVIDVRNSKSVDGWIQSTVDKLGKLDGAVNMAGVITPAAPITEETDDNWDFTFAVNTRGVFFCLRAQLKAMKAGGSIVSLISVSNRRDTMLNPLWNRFLLQVCSDKWVPPVSRPIAPAKQLLLG